MDSEEIARGVSGSGCIVRAHFKGWKFGANPAYVKVRTGFDTAFRVRFLPRPISKPMVSIRTMVHKAIREHTAPTPEGRFLLHSSRASWLRDIEPLESRLAALRKKVLDEREVTVRFVADFNEKAVASAWSRKYPDDKGKPPKSFATEFGKRVAAAFLTDRFFRNVGTMEFEFVESPLPQVGEATSPDRLAEAAKPEWERRLAKLVSETLAQMSKHKGKLPSASINRFTRKALILSDAGAITSGQLQELIGSAVARLSETVIKWGKVRTILRDIRRLSKEMAALKEGEKSV